MIKQSRIRGVDLMGIFVTRKPIAIWERYYRATETAPSRYEHNHIEDGHTELDYPKPMCNEQMKAWYGADGWRKTHAYLDEGNHVVGA